MAKYTRLSQRKYAELIGVSNTAVSKAISTGKIVKGFDKAKGEILVEIANNEWGNLHAKTNLEDLIKQANEGEDKPKKTGPLSMTEAKTLIANLDAKLKSLELQRETGEMVKKDDVRRELFAFGVTVRTTILAVPDRVIDDILASKSRAEAHGILYNALTDALTDLTTKKDFDFSPQ